MFRCCQPILMFIIWSPQWRSSWFYTIHRWSIGSSCWLYIWSALACRNINAMIKLLTTSPAFSLDINDAGYSDDVF
ncbi:hypothetical protein EJ08DRAFT_303413 [Tothia fuscella]|uniref:Uncharacterized protein n=1 Tax=Tothia fuscella TaxID=1048955 RepID=A0A9P4TX51_9PEZI|nr:hypothetical protein EJ08DRAFT_303413 [Tothia fuscella]